MKIVRFCALFKGNFQKFCYVEGGTPLRTHTHTHQAPPTHTHGCLRRQIFTPKSHQTLRIAGDCGPLRDANKPKRVPKQSTVTMTQHCWQHATVTSIRTMKNMPPRKELSIDLKDASIRQHQLGKSIYQMSYSFNMPHSTVHDIITRWRTTSKTNPPRSGCPWKLSQMLEAKLSQAATVNLKATWQDLKDSLGEAG